MYVYIYIDLFIYYMHLDTVHICKYIYIYIIHMYIQSMNVNEMHIFLFDPSKTWKGPIPRKEAVKHSWRAVTPGTSVAVLQSLRDKQHEAGRSSSGSENCHPLVDLVEGKIYRKSPYVMGKSMVSCTFSLQIIH